MAEINAVQNTTRRAALAAGAASFAVTATSVARAELSAAKIPVRFDDPMEYAAIAVLEKLGKG
jgi:hypothetical protein